VAIVVLRGIRFLFTWARGIEGLGLGDADLMMMAGAFVGWQIVVVAFFAAVLPGLVIGLAQLVFRGDRPFPHGPPLAAGVLLSYFCWPKIGPYMWIPLGHGPFLTILFGFGAVMLVILSFVLRMMRGVPPDEPDEKASQKS
jgi:leader peptidase (prepilin peptidase)/N-methyltransferase